MEECKVEIKRIMAALDLSSYSEATFAHALTLAKAMKAELVLLNVISTRGLDQLSRFEAMGYDISLDRYVREVEIERRKVFEQEYLTRVGDVPARVVFRQGITWEEILQAIKDEKADMLVMGTKGPRRHGPHSFGHRGGKGFPSGHLSGGFGARPGTVRHAQGLDRNPDHWQGRPRRGRLCASSVQLYFMKTMGEFRPVFGRHDLHEHIARRKFIVQPGALAVPPGAADRGQAQHAQVAELVCKVACWWACSWPLIRASTFRLRSSFKMGEAV